jgi:hypothetical protein
VGRRLVQGEELGNRIILAITIGKGEDFKRADPSAWCRSYEQINRAVDVNDQCLAR